jgi:hypothetical protein
MEGITVTTPTLAPTTKAKVNAQSSFGFSCYVELAETERIIIEVAQQVYDSKVNNWVISPTKEKYQLERLDYRANHDYNWGDKEAQFDGGIIRGFRKDGALRYRETYIPRHQFAEVLAQIPDHYHDYAREQFTIKMQELQEQVEITIKNGLQLQ